MSTADKLENDVLLTDFRERVNGINNRIAQENQRADDLIRENSEKHEHYLQSLQKQETLRREMGVLRNKIVSVSTEDLEMRIKTQTEINSQLEQMVRTAQEHLDKAEGRMDELMDKRNGALWKMEELNTNLEYTTLANERKTNEYNQVSDSLPSKEQEVKDLEESVLHIQARELMAQEKIVDLEQKISYAEGELEKIQNTSKDLMDNFRQLLFAAHSDLSGMS